MKAKSNSITQQQLDPIEVIDNLETLKRIIQQKDIQIKRMEIEQMETLNKFQLAVAKDQDGLKQDILGFMLRDNEQSKRIEQLHINYELLQNQFENQYIESNNKIKTLLNINDKKDSEIEQLKQQLRNKEERVNHMRNNSQNKERDQFEIEINQNRKIEDLQKKEADLTAKLMEALNQNQQLQEYFDNYQSEKEIKLIKQVEHLKKQNTSQINNLSQNYEMQVQTSKEVVEQLQDHILSLKDKLNQLQDENKKLKYEVDISNSKINSLLQIIEKLQETEKLHDQTRKQLQQTEESKISVERNYKLELQALQIQLEQAQKYIDLTTQLQTKLNKTDAELSYFREENQQLHETIHDLRNQMSSIEQHFELNVEEQRKANILLSKKEFELQTILDSQAKNFFEQEQQLRRNYEDLHQEYLNLQYAYQVLKQKNGDDTFRLKLYKTIEKKQSRIGLGSETRLTNTQKDYQSNKETIKINDEGFMQALENYQPLEHAKSMGNRLNRDVYIRKE